MIQIYNVQFDSVGREIISSPYLHFVEKNLSYDLCNGNKFLLIHVMEDK